MKEISTVGNLPKCFQPLAKEVQGVRSTLFYEMETAAELELYAKDQKCEELTCVFDKKNDRGYMSGFSFTDSAIKSIGASSYNRDKMVVMSVYYVELSDADFKEYSTTLDRHRQLQEEDMQKRRAKKKLIEMVQPGGNQNG